MHQLAPHPSNVRVRVWRRLQQIGALIVKHAVYVLPDSPDAREDFEWLKAEIEGAGGKAGVFSADSVDAWSDDALVEEFRRTRQTDYATLAREIETALRAVRGARKRSRPSLSNRPLEAFRQRFEAIEQVDFFGAAGRDRVMTLLDEFTKQLSPVAPTATKAPRKDTSTGDYRRRLWVTRPRPGVDRMASAWLIRRFIDPEARFGFVSDRERAPREAVPFDMFGVEFSHHGGNCTFETLGERFEIVDSAVTRLIGIIHDLDLKDGRFGAPEAPAIGAVIEGLQLTEPRDDVLLELGITLFESLYRVFDQSAKRAGPRPVARQCSLGATSRRARQRVKRRRGGVPVVAK